MKKAWMTSLDSYEDAVSKLVSQMKTYGVEVHGHFWRDDLEKMAWAAAREELVKPDVSLWLILAGGSDLDSASVRYGLSLLAMTVRSCRGASFPVVILHPEEDPPDTEMLPTLLRGAVVHSLSDPALGAKLVAIMHTKGAGTDEEYRLDVYGNEKIGQWFEVGPDSDTWSGAMFGIDEGEITFHGVGPKGSLPERAVLNYASKGIKMKLGDREYTAWSVRNELDKDTSYFIQVKGFPSSIVFGPFSEDEAAEVYVLKTR